MKTIITAVALVAALTSTTTAHASATHKKSAMKSAALICPVTGDKIASAKAAVGHETYKGKTYYFCCSECKPRFDKDRAGVAAHAAKGKYEKM
jgi:YHS domain-containing protein